MNADGKKRIRVLFLEDVEDDTILAVRELTRGGFDVTFERVDALDAFGTALDSLQWDVVIADYSLPTCNALGALAIVNARKLDIPFIVISGSVGEETAVEAIRGGAHDFLVKGKFARLVSVVERELRDGSLRAERAKMRQQLLISDRMASVGTLAAGLTHEINNPLSVIIANLDFMARDVGRLVRSLASESNAAAPPLAGSDGYTAALIDIDSALQDAREAAERIRVTVAELKLFSRVDDDALVAVDIHRVLDSSLRMAGNELRHRATVVKEYGDVPRVSGNEGRLGQVFLNLLVNAAHAIPEGRAAANEIRISTRRDGDDHVIVDIRDTGIGIPDDVLPRIFDPFFTTKPIGIGTGLGLAICHRIVVALHGHIHVESRVGEGSLFRTTLLSKANDTVSAPSLPNVPLHDKRGRILIVDDEITLGNALRAMLDGDHDVASVTSARLALARIADGQRFDVILCDLMMPEMTGMDLYETLIATAPDQAARMVFMTGGAFTVRAREFLKQATNRRLEKPFVPGQLRAVVGELLR